LFGSIEETQRILVTFEANFSHVESFFFELFESLFIKKRKIKPCFVKNQYLYVCFVYHYRNDNRYFWLCKMQWKSEKAERKSRLEFGSII
jgi:hypothetical protein